MVSRRTFLQGLASGTFVASPESLCRLGLAAQQAGSNRPISAPLPEEDVFRFIKRLRGAHDATFYAQILGAANEFKEGDSAIGVAAFDEASRRHSRVLLANTRLADIDDHPLHADDLFRFISVPREEQSRKRLSGQTLGQFQRFLLTSDESAIQEVMSGLSSDVISCVVKLMTNEELIQVGRKVFNPLPGSQIGANGYLGARIQPNSPTDNVDDVRWQVFDGWAYAVGDVLLGTNPVSSDPASVAAIQRTLQDVLTTFEINNAMPHCVLSHIDVQAEVESRWPGSTELWFQSIAGSDAANATFDISIEKMRQYAETRTGHYGLYFETGQGADFTNGHSHGFDMVMHESRKYGFARALTGHVASVRQTGGDTAGPWVHLNDVAGFIGPEVFRTREQLVRCCLEDIVMGKLHGLCIGLDVCSTLHMDISLDDLDWCLDQIMPAYPAYMMALPTKIDPMLGYLTTGYQDHVRLREKFGCRVNDEMWSFFQQLGVIDQSGRPTEHFGDPLWVFLQYRRRKGDTRNDQAILKEGREELEEVRGRGLFIAQGYGAHTWDLQPVLQDDIHRIYDDAKLSIWAELPDAFINRIPNGLHLATNSADRKDYILHPVSGEQLHDSAITSLQRHRQRQAEPFDVQIVVSDGLNALAITEEGHLFPFLDQLRSGLGEQGLSVSDDHLVVTSGRVRAGYRIGEILFGRLKGPRAIVHVIGERPGTGHRTFSVYMTAPVGEVWGREDAVDHNITKVVSGIATTALNPVAGADEVVRLLNGMMDRSA
ncbi:MAG: ethanolamine ammonia-lyase subunit EutB [Fuerstiella sp.]|nr:ethanolamine ammonia-lyase subunit EutB [Fuerstiella sp.]